MDAEDKGRQSLPPVTSQLRGLLKPDSPLPKDWDCKDLWGSGKMKRFGAQHYTRDRTHFRSSAIAVMPPSSFVA